jgi:hypothetical protein
MRQILALAGDQTVDDADAFAAPDQLFSQVGPDEAGTAGDEDIRHGWVIYKRDVRGEVYRSPTVSRFDPVRRIE